MAWNHEYEYDTGPAGNASAEAPAASSSSESHPSWPTSATVSPLPPPVGFELAPVSKRSEDPARSAEYANPASVIAALTASAGRVRASPACGLHAYVAGSDASAPPSTDRCSRR